MAQDPVVLGAVETLRDDLWSEESSGHALERNC